MKKLISALLAALLCASLAACGGGAPAQTGDADETVTLKVWSWDVAYAYLNDIKTEYENAHPQIKIELEEMGTTQIYNKLTTSFASGSGLPDVVSVEGEQLVKFGTKFPDKILELSDVVDAGEFMPVKMAEVTVDGKIMAFPWDSAPAALFYRKDIFEQAGVNPDDIKTWGDFVAAGKTVLEKTGVKMMPMSSSRSDIFFRMLMNQANGFYFDNEGNSTINSETAKISMRQVKEIYDAGLTLEYASWDEYVTCMKEGTVACVPEAVWIIGSFKEEAPETKGKWGVMEFPVLGDSLKGVATNGGSVICIPSATKYPEQAKEFVKYAMTDTDAQIKAFTQYGLFPSYLPVFKSEKFSDTDEFFNNEPVYQMFGEMGQRIPMMNFTPNFEEATEMSRNAMAKVTLDGANPDETLDDLQAQFITKFSK